MADAAAYLSGIHSMQAIFQTLATLQMTASLMPLEANITGTSMDYIIVGGGTAGCILANRLTVDPDVNVLLIEAGGDPPLEAVIASYFAYLPNSQYDWNLTYSDENTIYHRNGAMDLSSGRVLGGGSTIDHFLYMRGVPSDYDAWAMAANDSSWGWDGIFKQFLKSEQLIDEEILSSDGKNEHGLSGFNKITRETNDKANNILKAFEELGNEIILDITRNNSIGYAQSMYSNAIKRQDTATTYLSAAKDRTNLYVLKNTFVKKILFEGTTAVGVEAVREDEEVLTISAAKEIIVSAGTFNTPKLLMLSGIGPEEHLKSFGISVIADLPVGQNLQDQACNLIVHQMEESHEPNQPLDVTKFPGVGILGRVALNKSQNYPDYQTTNVMVPNDSTAIFGICMIIFSYNDDICQKMYEATFGRNVLLTVHNTLHQKSRGEVLLSSADWKDSPTVVYPAYLEEEDVEFAVDCVLHFTEIVNSTYFSEVGANLLDLGLEACTSYELGTRDYWRCYIKKTVGTMFNWSSTAPLGTVVDSHLRVLGVSGLRVCDASIIPENTIGKIKGPVMSIAEKGAEIIIADNQAST